MKKFILNIIVFALSLAACLAILEIGLRISGYGALQRVVMGDPVFGYRLRPDKRTVCAGVEIKISSQGLRDELHIMPKPPGAYRILFLGDSQTFGAGVRADEAFPKQVGSLLGVETINTGCPGWGPDQEVLFLKNYGIRFQPVVAVLAIFIGNDFDDLLANPEDRYIVTDLSGFQPCSEGALAGKHTSFSRKVKSLLRYQCRTYAFLADKSKLVKANNNSLYARKFKLENRIPFALQIYKIVETAESQTARQRMDVVISDFAAYCREQHIEPYVAIIPSQDQTDEKRFEKIVKTYGLNLSDFDRTLPNKALVAFCRTLNVECFDGYSVIADNSQEGPQGAYLVNDTHLNRYGHRIIAEGLARVLPKRRPIS